MEDFPMRATLPLSALVLILSLAPASAMCGGMGQAMGQQAQAPTPGQSANPGSTQSPVQGRAQSGTQPNTQGGMMCGRPSSAAQAEDPFGMKPSEPQQQQSGMGMCPCCRNMAMMGGGMMRGGMMGGKQSDDPHKGMNMPGMDMSPKQ
jgi:hypothetical protein